MRTFFNFKLVATEAITTAIIDEYSNFFRHRINLKYIKEILSGVNVFVSFLCGLPMITYVNNIFDFETYLRASTMVQIHLQKIVN